MSSSSGGPCANVQAGRCSSRAQNGKKNQGCKHEKCKQCCLRDHHGQCSTPSHRMRASSSTQVPPPPPPVAPLQQLQVASSLASSPSPAIPSPPSEAHQLSTATISSLATRTAGHAQPLHNMWTTAPAGWAQLQSQVIAEKEAAGDRKRALSEAKAADQRRVDIRVWKEPGQAPFLSTAEVKNYPFFRIVDHDHLVAQLASSPPPAPFEKLFAQIYSNSSRQKGWVLTSFTTERQIDTSEKELLVRFVAHNQLAGPFLRDEDCPDLPKYALSSSVTTPSIPSPSECCTPTATPTLKRVRSHDDEDKTSDEHPAKRKQVSTSQATNSPVIVDLEPNEMTRRFVRSRSSPGPLTVVGDESSSQTFLRVIPHHTSPSTRRSISTIRSTPAKLPPVAEVEESSPFPLLSQSMTLSVPRPLLSQSMTLSVPRHTASPAYGPDENHVREGEVPGVHNNPDTQKPQFPSWWFVCFIKEGIDRGEAAKAQDKNVSVAQKKAIAFPGLRCSDSSYNKAARYFRTYPSLLSRYVSMGKTPRAVFHFFNQEVEKLQAGISGETSHAAASESAGEAEDSHVDTPSPNIDEPVTPVTNETSMPIHVEDVHFGAPNGNNSTSFPVFGSGTTDWHDHNLFQLISPLNGLSSDAERTTAPDSLANDPFISSTPLVADTSSGFVLPGNTVKPHTDIHGSDEFSEFIRSLPPPLPIDPPPSFYTDPSSPHEHPNTFHTIFTDIYDIPPLTPNGLASVLTPKTKRALLSCLPPLSSDI